MIVIRKRDEVVAGVEADQQIMVKVGVEDLGIIHGKIHQNENTTHRIIAQVHRAVLTQRLTMLPI